MSKRRQKVSPPPENAPTPTPVWASDSVLLGGFLFLVAWLGCYEIVSADFWWHLRTGQLIWQRGEIPTHDWYTYTNPDSTWIDLHWTFQLAVAGLWELGGSTAIILAKSALGLLTFGMILLAARRSWPAPLLLVFLIPALVIFAGRYYARPEMVSVALLATQLCVLRFGQDRPRLLWLLPVIQLLWVNAQGLFVLGLLVQAAFLLDRTLLFAWRKLQSTDQVQAPSLHLRTVWIVSGLVVAACFVNPYGLQGVLFPLILRQRIAGPQSDFYKQFSGEFLGIDDFVRDHGVLSLLFNMSTAMLLTLFVIGVVSFVVLAREKQFSVFRFALFCGFAYFTFLASRNSILFAVVGGFVATQNFGQWSEGNPKLWTSPLRMRAGLLLVLILLIAAAPLGTLAWARGAREGSSVPRRFGLGVVDIYAFPAAEFLDQPGMPERIYANHLGQAAVCIYVNGPEQKVFADARLEVNTQQTLAAYRAVIPLLIDHDPRAMTLLSQGGEPPALLFDLTLLARNKPLWDAMVDHPRYRCVYIAEDYTGVVFLEQERVEELGLKEFSLEQFLQELVKAEG